MPKITDRQHAVESFKQFVARHRASQGRHVGFVSEPPPFVESVELNRSDVIDTYLRLHPGHEEYREDIKSSLKAEQIFSLSKKLWDETISKLPVRNTR